MSSVYIVLLTFERLEYAIRALRSTLDNILYDSLSVHIADDGSSEDYRQTLVDIAGGYENVQGVTVTNSERGGYGRSYNLAMQIVHLYADIVLPLEDDWELRRPLDLFPLVEALQTGEFGCIRLGYIGFTQPLKGELTHVAAHTYLRFDHDSPEPHVWAGHPRLESREWQRSVGPWPEGLDPGSTEFSVAHRPKAREGVAWPLDLIHPIGDLFHHVGATQARVDQREIVEV